MRTGPIPEARNSTAIPQFNGLKTGPMGSERRSNLPFLILLPTGILLCGPDAVGDELLMRDGSRLVGEVIKRENGTLEFKTAFAGVIKVRWDQVVELQADSPMKLMLDDETTISATRIRNDNDELIVEGESGLPPQTLGQSTVAFINPEPWRTGEGYKLSGIVNFALQKERGNTDKDEIEVDGDLTWRFRHDRFKMIGELERDRSNNKKTKGKWKLNNSYDHFFTKKWFAGGILGFEHDQFADLNLRTRVGPKIGYQWFEGKTMNLSTAVGPIYVKEHFSNQSNDDFISAGWAIDFDRYLFQEFVQLYHRQTGLWNLEDTSDVVWDTWTGLRFPLVIGFVASTELQTEYDSGAAKDADELDTTYRLKLGYKW
jgi:putative salt-induced outer membrane protein YdiY